VLGGAAVGLLAGLLGILLGDGDQKRAILLGSIGAGVVFVLIGYGALLLADYLIGDGF
jgi:hypothetical protein